MDDNDIDELTIKPIAPENVVENGALIVVCGDKQSGKTCVVENMLYHRLESFMTPKFPPMYIGEDVHRAVQYFGKLFNTYHSLRNGENSVTLAQAHIWQYGYQNELEESKFRRQGEKYVAEQQKRYLRIEEAPVRPRLLFYFDDCENFPFVEACLAKTPDHRQHKTISVVETRSMLDIGKLQPQILIYTSALDNVRHVGLLERMLKTKKSVARDLVETANSFIRRRQVALLINLHQWFETKQKRGFYIYTYSLVPPLYEQLRLLGHDPPPQPDKKKEKKSHHQHNEHHQPKHSAEKTITLCEPFIDCFSGVATTEPSRPRRRRHRHRHVSSTPQHKDTKK